MLHEGAATFQKLGVHLPMFIQISNYSSPPLLFPLPPLEVGHLNTARGSEERCKLPQQGMGWCPSGKFGAF